MGLPVCLASSQQVRSFARALGELAKTDRLEARLLLRYLSDCSRGGSHGCGLQRGLTAHKTDKRLVM